MNRRLGRALGLLAVVIMIGIWLALHRLEWPTRLMTAVLLGPLPILGVLQARLLDELPAEAERHGVYLSSAVSIWVLAVLAMAAARYGGLSRAELGITTLPLPELLGAAGLTTLAGLAIMAVGRFIELPETALDTRCRGASRGPCGHPDHAASLSPPGSPRSWCFEGS